MNMKEFERMKNYTQVTFKTSDETLQKLFDTAEKKEKNNIKDFHGIKVLTEGGGYKNVWLETQPMGGEMYAKRDLETGLNNQLIFLDNLNDKGRFPGMVSLVDDKLKCDYEWLQGFCFPRPALNMYYLAGKDENYLNKLYNALEKFDGYLWKYRDSNGDGCLETWCIWDNGEDHSTRLTGAPNKWGGETPPQGLGKVPYASMDFMAYSYDTRAVLAIISDILRNGQGGGWRTKAEEVRRKIRDYLWREEKHACYDRDCNNEFMDVLIHNNLRVMYHGAFEQDMADRFVKYHMLNPEEFWTKMPLPSIAINDPLFRNITENNWSGQPEGLTYQRAIRALENYGHYAEITMLGWKLIEAAGADCVFTQQFDPFTGKPSIVKSWIDNSVLEDDYGPTILAVLEYISRLYGIHIEGGQIYWGGLANNEHRSEYVQNWNGRCYKSVNADGKFTAFINGKQIFSCSNGVRIVTDYNGNVLEIIGIDIKPVTAAIKTPDIEECLKISPNATYSFADGKFILKQAVSFDYPYSKE